MIARDRGRRAFLRRAARYLLSAGLAVMIVRLIVGGRVRVDGGCGGRDACRGCPSLPGCGLPEAVQARAAWEGR